MSTILVVDDDATIRAVIRLFLEAAGHLVIEAANGRRCMEAFRDQPVDAVIVDIFMPEKDGIETIQDIRDKDDACKILAISGGSERMGLDFLRHAKSFGADEILVKPFSESELLGAVARLLPSPGPAIPAA